MGYFCESIEHHLPTVSERRGQKAVLTTYWVRLAVHQIGMRCKKPIKCKPIKVGGYLVCFPLVAKMADLTSSVTVMA